MVDEGILPKEAAEEEKKKPASPGRFSAFVKRHPRLYLIWAFVIPFMLMWMIYIAMEVWPFGENSVLVLDLNGQYVSFFEALRSLILNGGSLAYSWERALGGEFMGIYAYYLASPLSILVALFPKRMITEALLLMLLTKCGLCGLSMAFYLEMQYPSKRVNTVIFATMYALTAFAVVQAHNTMWIDELVLLPILTLGIDRLISHRQYALYTASIAMSMLVNFYIGYMMCIYTLFYFFYSYFFNNFDNRNNVYGEKRHFLRSLLRMGALTVIGLAIAAVVWLPTYYSLTFGKTTFSDPSYAFSQQFDFLDFFVKLFPGSYDTVRPSGLPFVYCGTLTLLLLPIYFISPKIRPREKMIGGLGVAFFLLCFNGSTIDLVWHGFQRPNWLNYRYSFMFCFLIILFAYRAFDTIDRVDFKWPVLTAGILGVILMVIQKLDYSFVDDLRNWYVRRGRERIGSVPRADAGGAARRGEKDAEILQLADPCHHRLRRDVHGGTAEPHRPGRGRGIHLAQDLCDLHGPPLPDRQPGPGFRRRLLPHGEIGAPQDQ